MVMYKQNRGLVAGGTIGPQSTGPMMAPKKKPQYGLQSTGGNFELGGVGNALSQVGKGVGSFINTLGQAGVLGGQSRGNLFTYTPPSFAGTQPSQQPAQAQQAPPMPTPVAPARQTALSQAQVKELIDGGYIYTARGMTNEGMLRAYNKMMADRGAPAATRQASAQPAQQPETVTGDYRMPIKDPYEDLLNPYGDDYRTGLMSRASGEVARQFAPQREQLAANLAARGISPDSPLFQSIMAQQTQSEAASRASGVASAEREGLQSWANFELQKRAGKAGYINQLQAAGERLARQPAEIGSLQAKAQADVANAALASMNAETRLKFSQELEKSIENEFLMQGYRADQAKIEANAAARLFEQTDPDQWYNQPWWPIVGKVAAGLVGAGVGFLIGGPPMAAYGGAIGAGIFPAGVPAPQVQGTSGMMSRPAAPAPRPPIYTGGGLA